MAAWVDVEAYVERETGVKTGAAVGWGRVRPAYSAWSEARMPAPPEGVAMPTPRALGLGALAGGMVR